MVESNLLPLSPSRAADFKTCPQLFKFRSVDRLPEPRSAAAARGSLVHLVLERLFQLKGSDRTKSKAEGLLVEINEDLNREPELFPLLSPEDEAKWLEQCRELIENYFLLERPETLEPSALEAWVEVASEKVNMRGIIDRLDVDEDGEWTLSDYKTGSSPSDWASFGSFFALRFYALVCWRAFGKMPKELRLVHLKAPEIITLQPNERMLKGLERQLEAIGTAIRRAHATDDWRPRQSHACNWCPHKAICPAWAESAVESEERSA